MNMYMPHELAEVRIVVYSCLPQDRELSVMNPALLNITVSALGRKDLTCLLAYLRSLTANFVTFHCLSNIQQESRESSHLAFFVMLLFHAHLKIWTCVGLGFETYPSRYILKKC